MTLETYISIVKALGKNTKCKRKEVGAILLKDDRIISTGYNGLPSGSDDIVCNERCKGCALTVHAEMNSILFAAKHGISTQDSTLFASWSPCLNCAKHIINAGIKEVNFLRLYDKLEGMVAIKLLEEHGCKVNHIVEYKPGQYQLVRIADELNLWEE